MATKLPRKLLGLPFATQAVVGLTLKRPGDVAIRCSTIGYCDNTLQGGDEGCGLMLARVMA